MRQSNAFKQDESVLGPVQLRVLKAIAKAGTGGIRTIEIMKACGLSYRTSVTNAVHALEIRKYIKTEVRLHYKLGTKVRHVFVTKAGVERLKDPGVLKRTLRTDEPDVQKVLQSLWEQKEKWTLNKLVLECKTTRVRLMHLERGELISVNRTLSPCRVFITPRGVELLETKEVLHIQVEDRGSHMMATVPPKRTLGWLQRDMLRHLVEKGGSSDAPYLYKKLGEERGAVDYRRAYKSLMCMVDRGVLAKVREASSNVYQLTEKGREFAAELEAWEKKNVSGQV